MHNIHAGKHLRTGFHTPGPFSESTGVDEYLSLREVGGDEYGVTLTQESLPTEWWHMCVAVMKGLGLTANKKAVEQTYPRCI